MAAGFMINNTFGNQRSLPAANDLPLQLSLWYYDFHYHHHYIHSELLAVITSATEGDGRLCFRQHGM